MHTDPEMTIQDLTGLQTRLVDRLSFLMKCRRERTGSAAMYCFPSQGWLAKSTGVVRETVNRALQDLYRRGVLDIVHRRKKGGFWQTCLYKLRNCRAWGHVRAHRLLRSVASRVTKTSHIVPPPKGTTIKDSARLTPEQIKVGFQSIFDALKPRVG